MRNRIFDAIGGQPVVDALARAWHRHCLADPVVSHAFNQPGQHPRHLERLAAYWAEALGGPTVYTDTMGDHSRVMRLHSGNGDHQDMDERAQRCFAAALDDVGIPDDGRLRATLTDWFRWATSDLTAYPDSAGDVPPNLDFPYWTWDGVSR